MRLQDRVAVITGGSRGIGRGIALAFAREGADVAIAGRNPESLASTAAEIEALGRRAVTITGDVSVSEDCRRVVANTHAAFGKVDILVNNAAGGAVARPLHEIDEESWDACMTASLKSAFLCSRWAIPHMLEQGGGNIIMISSIRGIGARVNYSPYCTAKAGMNHLTRCMALDYAQNNIRVNCIAPGAIETERTRSTVALLDDPASLADYMATAPPAQRERLERLQSDPQAREGLLGLKSPMQRRGTVEECAGAALFLASDDAAFVTGHIMVVDGGRTLE